MPLSTAPSANLSAEADSTRWRQVEQRFAEIERQIGRSVRYNSVAAPGGSEIQAGTVRAGKILGPTGPNTATMTSDFANILTSVFDASSVTRVQFGNLAANGISPAQYGLRVNDASGNPIFDSTGYIKTFQNGGSAAGAPAANVAAGTVTGSTFTLTVPGTRNVNVLYLIHATGKTAGAGGNLSYVTGKIATVASSASIKFDKANTGIVPGFIWYFNNSGIAPGAYTVTMEVAVDVGQTCYLDQWFHQAWLLGAT